MHSASDWNSQKQGGRSVPLSFRNSDNGPPVSAHLLGSSHQRVFRGGSRWHEAICCDDEDERLPMALRRLDVVAPNFLIGLDLRDRLTSHVVRVAPEGDLGTSVTIEAETVTSALRVVSEWAKAWQLDHVELRTTGKTYRLR